MNLYANSVRQESPVERPIQKDKRSLYPFRHKNFGKKNKEEIEEVPAEEE